MTVQPVPDVALPDGADLKLMADDDWQMDGQRRYRYVWSPSFEADLDVRVVVKQFCDGSICTEGDDAPLIYIGDNEFLSDDARAIAASLVRAADLADKWGAR